MSHCCDDVAHCYDAVADFNHSAFHASDVEANC